MKALNILALTLMSLASLQARAYSHISNGKGVQCSGEIAVDAAVKTCVPQVIYERRVDQNRQDDGQEVVYLEKTIANQECTREIFSFEFQVDGDFSKDVAITQQMPFQVKFFSEVDPYSFNTGDPTVRVITYPLDSYVQALRLVDDKAVIRQLLQTLTLKYDSAHADLKLALGGALGNFATEKAMNLAPGVRAPGFFQDFNQDAKGSLGDKKIDFFFTCDPQFDPAAQN